MQPTAGLSRMGSLDFTKRFGSPRHTPLQGLGGNEVKAAANAFHQLGSFADHLLNVDDDVDDDDV
jgi:hypothetical protein